MKKVLFITALGFGMLAFQSCSKCGQCIIEYKTGITTSKNTGDVYCGNDNNESGSYYKAAKLECEQYPVRYTEQNPLSTTIVTSSWADVK